MKKMLIALLIISCIACSVFSASTVSWEGRAAVGSSGIFPGRGMYALSRVFSTGEIVEVYNPVNQKKVTVVISNNTDLSGILVLLSPEASNALDIVSGSDSVVRVSKIPEYALRGVPDESYRTPSVIEDTPLVQDAVVSEPVAVESNELNQLADPIAVTEEIAEAKEDTAPAVIDDVQLVNATEEGDLPDVDEPKFEEDDTILKEVVSYSLVPTNELPPEQVYAEPVPENNTATPAEIVTEAFDSSDIEAKVALQGEQIALLKEEVAAQEDALLSLKNDLDTPKDGKTEQEAVSYSLSDDAYAKYVKPLESGLYYVQFAYLMDEKNIDLVLSQYERYPLVMHKKSNGYQMLVGPLGANEYKAVEEQFKQFGFKDTFSKIGQ